ncbi:MAG: calcium-binding protein, partial [Symploca sp. SIO1B1]|nr:calcium-binding protein [Symploca sp. SIO1B1]
QGDQLISIEDVKGSIFNDYLIGSASANYLDGFSGNDRIIGGGGADTLDGGDGIDWVSYATSLEGVNVSLKTGKGRSFGSFDLGGGDGRGDVLQKMKDNQNNDTAYNSFENLEGSSVDDALEGDIGNNILKGLAGNDTLKGDGGDDTLIGGAGADSLDGGVGTDDWADYSDSSAAVTVNLQVGVGSGGDAQGDTFARVNGKSTVENLLGSNFADTLFGDDGDNEINPGLSNSKNNEFDVVDGGAGDDLLILDYGSVNDIGTGLFGGFTGSYIGFGPGLGFFRNTSDGSRFLDAVAFENIERLNIIGTEQNDEIYGGAGDDILLPGAGDDIIYGGRGNNTILANDGNDVVIDQDVAGKFVGIPNSSKVYLDGGRGIDTLSIDLSARDADNAYPYGDVTLISLDPSQESNTEIQLLNGSVIKNFEIFKNIKTGISADKIVQLGRVDNVIELGSGSDIVNPGLGFDNVDGGSFDSDQGPGSDTLILDYSVGDIGTGMFVDILSNNPFFGGSYYRYKNEQKIELLDRVQFRNFTRYEITGTSKSDRFIGGDGSDIFKGQAGNDNLYGGLGDDILEGGDGDDWLADGDDPPGAEFISIRSGGNDVFEGGDGNDSLFGLAGDDQLFGEGGNDSLFGGEGNDTLDGGDGDDVLRGVEPFFSKGNEDVLTGGAGADKFQLGDDIFVYYDDGDANTLGTEDFARITDFNPTEGDIIQLHGYADDYSLFITPTSTAIYLGTFNIDSPLPELIAIVEGTSNLNLSNNYFEFLGQIGE